MLQSTDKLHSKTKYETLYPIHTVNSSMSTLGGRCPPNGFRWPTGNSEAACAWIRHVHKTTTNKPTSCNFIATAWEANGYSLYERNIIANHVVQAVSMRESRQQSKIFSHWAITLFGWFRAQGYRFLHWTVKLTGKQRSVCWCKLMLLKWTPGIFPSLRSLCASHLICLQSVGDFKKIEVQRRCRRMVFSGAIAWLYALYQILVDYWGK